MTREPCSGGINEHTTSLCRSAVCLVCVLLYISFGEGTKPADVFSPPPCKAGVFHAQPFSFPGARNLILLLRSPNSCTRIIYQPRRREESTAGNGSQLCCCLKKEKINSCFFCWAAVFSASFLCGVPWLTFHRLQDVSHLGDKGR